MFPLLHSHGICGPLWEPPLVIFFSAWWVHFYLAVLFGSFITVLFFSTSSSQSGMTIERSIQSTDVRDCVIA